MMPTGWPPACAKGLVGTWDTIRLREGLRDPDTAAEDGMGPSFQGWGKILGLENQAAPGSHT